MRRRLALWVLGLVMVMIALPVAAQQPPAAGDTTGDFTVLVAAVRAAGFETTLAQGGPYTVFAPTDAAFANALAALGLTPEALLADVPLLREVLAFHIVPGRYTSDVIYSLRLPNAFPTLGGAFLPFTYERAGAPILLNNGAARVIRADVPARNGVVHAIDTVLIPPTLAARLAAPVIVVPTPTLAPTEVPTDAPTPTLAPTQVPTDAPTPTLAPTEVPTDAPTPTLAPTEAPTDAPTPTLAPTLAAPAATPLMRLAVPTVIPLGAAGVVPAPTTPVAETPAEAPATGDTDAPLITDLAVADGNFTVLVAALQAANLTPLLAGPGPFTVLAPTDDAFRGFLAQQGLTPQELLNDTALLTDVLSAHVIPGYFSAATLIGGSPEGGYPTLAGTRVMIGLDAGGALSVDDGAALIVQPDLVAANGVIHAIDGVLLPPAEG